MTFDPSKEIQKLQYFGEFGGVNPSITDSSTFTFLNTDTMSELFDHDMEGCFLYSRHFNPMNKYLSDKLAAMEDTEAAQVTSSGMSAIACTVLQLCGQGDEIITDRTIYGGTYALFKNFLPRFGIKVRFIDIHDEESLLENINDKTKVVYCESISNPLLNVVDIPKLSKVTKEKGLKLVVDNTFSPLIVSPKRLGADIVIHSLTKFINGSSDCVAGVVCSTKEFILSLMDVNSGASMLLGPVLDSIRAAGILKNVHTLPLRMKKHSENASYIADNLSELGLKVHYPGLKGHPQKELIDSFKNPGYGYGGVLAFNVGEENASRVMELMQEYKVGYLAVSLGYFRSLFSAPSSSTSSEIPEDEQKQMGLSKGLIRLSVGLDPDINESFEKIKKAIGKVRSL